ncbi:hypothetical protein ACVOMT_05995 [Sphingomonas panni]
METAYLGILRVFILFAATAALIVAGIAAVSAISPLLKWTGLTESSQPDGGNLADFVKQQKPEPASQDGVANERQTDDGPASLPDIKAAARIISEYLQGRGSIRENEWRAILEQNVYGFAEHMRPYGESVRSLAEQLETSRGKPLSEERVVQLIDWHKANFAADIARRAAQESEGNAKFLATLAIAGSAFVAFILIIFVFIFVRIERNLRLVRTTNLVNEAIDA